MRRSVSYVLLGLGVMALAFTVADLALAYWTSAVVDGVLTLVLLGISARLR